MVYDETGGGTGMLEGRYLHGPGVDEVLSYWQPGIKTRWVWADRLGTVRDVVEINGTSVTVVEHKNYNSFGGITSDMNAGYDFRFGYTGRLWDADAQLQFNRARWYDPALGKFVSEDPLGFAAGDTNLTRYVAGDPVNFTDPSGLFFKKIGDFFEDVGEDIEEFAEDAWDNEYVRAGVYFAAATAASLVLAPVLPAWITLQTNLTLNGVGAIVATIAGGSGGGDDSSPPAPRRDPSQPIRQPSTGDSSGVVIRGQGPEDGGPMSASSGVRFPHSRLPKWPRGCEDHWSRKICEDTFWGDVAKAK